MDRRLFLASLGGLAAAFGPWRAGSARDGPAPGIQLYSVRRLMNEDAAATLATLAGMGYREVELAGLYGRSAAHMRRLLDDAGLVAPAGHVALDAVGAERRERTFERAATLGHAYVVVPWIDAAERTADGYRGVATALNVAGEAARSVGLRVGYHNHDYEFARVDGTRGYDLLLAETDPELVALEIDVYWMVKGGADPLEYIAAEPWRIELLHVKDMDAAGRMVDVGAGTIDFRSIIAAAREAGARHFFVEHDEPASPLDFARASLARLRALLRD